MINYLPDATECLWHRRYKETGHNYNLKETFQYQCPILWHTLYPYFLGASFGSRIDHAVCCPAEHGVDTIIKIAPYDERFYGAAPEDWRDVIHAEVVHSECNQYSDGEVIVFPTGYKHRNCCPAGVHNIFPFIGIEIPKCINLKRLRCPDWKENVWYSL